MARTLNVNGVEFKEFTKNDWQGFAGAVNFKNGTNPFIAEIQVDGKDAIVVVDGDGFGVYVVTDDGIDLTFVFNRPHNIIFLKPSMSQEEIEAMGGDKF